MMQLLVHTKIILRTRAITLKCIEYEDTSAARAEIVLVPLAIVTVDCRTLI